MLGTRIAMLRKQNGISQKELAERLGVSASSIGMYEQGRREPSGDRLVEMAAIFCVSTDYLLTGQIAEPRDEQAVSCVLNHAADRFCGQLLLQKPDGSTKPMGREDLLLLFAALLSH